MDYKYKTRAYYEHRGADFGSDKPDYHSFTPRFLSEDFGYFLHELQGSLVLDLGCGPGRDALLFREQGLHPICVDISPAMVHACKSKGLDSCVMDLENLGFADGFFNGVWAYTSLHHIPKTNVPSALAGIARVVKNKGPLFVGVKEGYFEGFVPSSNLLVPDECRFIAHYSEDELASLLSVDFDVIHSCRTQPDSHSLYLNFLCVKK